jgi:hypothetical protein
LIYAKINKMTEVIDIIYKNGDIQSILNLSPPHMELLNKYIDQRLTEKINQLYNAEYIETCNKNLHDIENRITKISGTGLCIICLDKTDRNTVFIKCKHIFHVCDECMYIVEHKCPICMKPTEIINNCYAIR